jgi:hypothetical protein
MTWRESFSAGAVFLFAFALANAQEATVESNSTPTVVQAILTAPGSPPFHLSAAITERADFNEHVDLEMYWMSPNKWRRTIVSQEFSQTLIVNGDKVFEQDSDDYFPLGLQTFAMALVDPQPILNSWRAGDQLLTKANGAADESGRVCFGGKSTMCIINGAGLTEIVGTPGHTVTFSDYRKFEGRRVARTVTYQIDRADSLNARVTELKEWRSADEGLFAIADATPKAKLIQSAVVTQAELSTQALQPLEIIWPQVLDGKTTGETSYYVSIDRSGQVREIVPLSVAVERADDSARRQIMKWKFKPLVKDGVPVQAESVLNFSFNTRAYGPPDMLTDKEGRKLATNAVEPEYPATVAPGGTCAIRVAVDTDGNVIEMIIDDCAPGLFQLCFEAMGKWQFRPIVQDGKSLPYRTRIIFRVP